MWGFLIKKLENLVFNTRMINDELKCMNSCAIKNAMKRYVSTINLGLTENLERYVWGGMKNYFFGEKISE